MEYPRSTGAPVGWARSSNRRSVIALSEGFLRKGSGLRPRPAPLVMARRERQVWGAKTTWPGHLPPTLGTADIRCRPGRHGQEIWLTQEPSRSRSPLPITVA